MSIRRRYDEELSALDLALNEMGRAAAAAIRGAIEVLQSGDRAAARRIVEDDDLIDGMEREIEHRCMQLLLRQQPVAGDLRRVSTALKLVTDIERMGDHAADIAEIALTLDLQEKSCHTLLAPVLEMARAALTMDETAIRSFVTENSDAALRVIAQDDGVDAQFSALKTAIAAAIAEDPACIDPALDLLMIAKYLERLGDHAVNVAEWVLFLKTGLYRGEQIV